MTGKAKNEIYRKVNQKLFSAGYTNPDISTGEKIGRDELEVTGISFGPTVREERHGWSVAEFDRYVIYVEEDGRVKVSDMKTGESKRLSVGALSGYLDSLS
jgi:hypothetical protein